MTPVKAGGLCEVYAKGSLHKLNHFLHTISQYLGVAARTMVVKSFVSVVDAYLRMLPKSLPYLDTVMWMGKHTLGDEAYRIIFW